MIPYDDLVAALTSWRARQGLPVTASAIPAASAAPASGPVSVPASGPVRSGPPMAPPKGGYQPPPLASPDTTDDSLDVDDAALLEDAYENEGSDFAMNFGGGVEHDAESTTLGVAPGSGTSDVSSRHGDSFGGKTESDPKSRKPW
ncbi:MAG TPA: hypothetical protein VK427_01490 [Kofleriaceae bacterium]|nr:hypothetical protein [Kofleriaceae bacterium]